MKDFRDRVVPNRPDRSQVTDLLKKGHISKALHKAQAAGVEISQEEIDAAAHVMYRAGRAGELLSLVGTTPVKLPYDTAALLRRTFEVGDRHTFLKQAHRLGVVTGFEALISEAIATIGEHAPREADAWRRKFGQK